MTIMGMILVNTPGSWAHIYGPLAHADWHGCTPTDLVFPFFLFISGISIAFSIQKFVPLPSRTWALKTLKRASLIFLLGVLLRMFPFHKILLEGNINWEYFSNFRIMGVLPRIAVAYCIAALMVNMLSIRKLIIASALILLGYWAVLVFWGGADPFSLEHSLVRKIDLWGFGEKHLWHGKGIAFDPEGLLSSLPAAVTVIMGYFVGVFIKSTQDKIVLVKKLLIAGIAFTALGWIWGLTFPINKSLWTSSYVLYTAGLGAILLSLLIGLIDILHAKKWTLPFIVYGMNPLALFVLSIMLVKTYFRISWGKGNAYAGLYKDIFVPLAGELNGSLLFALSHVLLFGIIGYIFYRKKIFIKI